MASQRDGHSSFFFRPFEELFASSPRAKEIFSSFYEKRDNSSSKTRGDYTTQGEHSISTFQKSINNSTRTIEEIDVSRPQNIYRPTDEIRRTKLPIHGKDNSVRTSNEARPNSIVDSNTFADNILQESTDTYLGNGHGVISFDGSEQGDDEVEKCNEQVMKVLQNLNKATERILEEEECLKTVKQKEHVLCNWSLQSVGINNNEKEIIVEGHRSEDPNEQNWRSTIIYERVSARSVKTKSGSLYRLSGRINMTLMNEKGFPPWLTKAFRNGFPSNWRSLLQMHINGTKSSLQQEFEKAEEREKSKKPDNKEKCIGNSKVAGKRKTTKVAQTGKEGPQSSKHGKGNNLEKSKTAVSHKSGFRTPPTSVLPKDHAVKRSRSGRVIAPPLEYWRGERMVATAHDDSIAIVKCHLEEDSVQFIQSKQTPLSRKSLSLESSKAKKGPVKGIRRMSTKGKTTSEGSTTEEKSTSDTNFTITSDIGSTVTSTTDEVKTKNGPTILDNKVTTDTAESGGISTYTNTKTLNGIGVPEDKVTTETVDSDSTVSTSTVVKTLSFTTSDTATDNNVEDRRLEGAKKNTTKQTRSVGLPNRTTTVGPMGRRSSSKRNKTVQDNNVCGFSSDVGSSGVDERTYPLRSAKGRGSSQKAEVVSISDSASKKALLWTSGSESNKRHLRTTSDSKTKKRFLRATLDSESNKGFLYQPTLDSKSNKHLSHQATAGSKSNKDLQETLDSESCTGLSHQATAGSKSNKDLQKTLDSESNKRLSHQATAGSKSNPLRPQPSKRMLTRKTKVTSDFESSGAEDGETAIHEARLKRITRSTNCEVFPLSNQPERRRPSKQQKVTKNQTNYNERQDEHHSSKITQTVQNNKSSLGEVTTSDVDQSVTLSSVDRTSHGAKGSPIKSGAQSSDSQGGESRSLQTSEIETRTKKVLSKESTVNEQAHDAEARKSPIQSGIQSSDPENNEGFPLQANDRRVTRNRKVSELNVVGEPHDAERSESPIKSGVRFSDSENSKDLPLQASNRIITRKTVSKSTVRERLRGAKGRKSSMKKETQSSDSESNKRRALLTNKRMETRTKKVSETNVSRRPRGAESRERPIESGTQSSDSESNKGLPLQAGLGGVTRMKKIPESNVEMHGAKATEEPVVSGIQSSDSESKKDLPLQASEESNVTKKRKVSESNVDERQQGFRSMECSITTGVQFSEYDSDKGLSLQADEKIVTRKRKVSGSNDEPPPHGEEGGRESPIKGDVMNSKGLKLLKKSGRKVTRMREVSELPNPDAGVSKKRVTRSTNLNDCESLPLDNQSEKKRSFKRQRVTKNQTKYKEIESSDSEREQSKKRVYPLRSRDPPHSTATVTKTGRVGEVLPAGKEQPKSIAEVPSNQKGRRKSIAEISTKRQERSGSIVDVQEQQRKSIAEVTAKEKEESTSIVEGLPKRNELLESTTTKTAPKRKKAKKTRGGKKNAPQNAQLTDEEMWSADEHERLEQALSQIPPATAMYWQKVALLVESRNAEDCQLYVQNVKNVKHQKKKKNPRKMEEKVVPKELTAKAGTLARTRQLRDMLEQQDDGYEDDLFDSTPFRNQKLVKFSPINLDDDIANEELDTNHLAGYATPFTRTPINRLRPAGPLTASGKSEHDYVSPGELLQTVDRNEVDRYVHQLKKRKRGRPVRSVKSNTPVPKKSSNPHPLSFAEGDCFDVREAPSDLEEEEDYYWSDE